MDDRAVRDRVVRVERALEALEGLPAGPRRTALDAVGLLVELYGEGWARALARLEASRPGAASALAEDELVGHLLLIHGLHPDDVESRVREALETVERAVNADGLRIELVELGESVARLRFDGNGHEPAAGFRDLVQQTVLGAAPELELVEIEMPASANGGSAGPALVQLRRPARQGEGEPAREDP